MKKINVKLKKVRDVKEGKYEIEDNAKLKKIILGGFYIIYIISFE